jgi:beta-glucanase (GH16 family)
MRPAPSPVPTSAKRARAGGCALLIGAVIGCPTSVGVSAQAAPAPVGRAFAPQPDNWNCDPDAMGKVSLRTSDADVKADVPSWRQADAGKGAIRLDKQVSDTFRGSARSKPFDSAKWLEVNPNWEGNFLPENTFRSRDGSAALTYRDGRGGTLFAKKATRYGYYEARMRMPRGGGINSGSFWLQSTSDRGPGAGGGELDVQEGVGTEPLTGTNDVSGGMGSNLNYRDPGGSWAAVPGMSSRCSVSGLGRWANASTHFHNYGMEWQKDFVALYVDGQLVRKTTAAEVDRARAGAWRKYFQAPMHLILDTENFSWYGDANTNKTSPAYVQWVRHWTDS